MGDSQLGIGSRIEHPKFGKGVIVDVDTEYYSIWFKEPQL
jgi:heat shock protein HspQ